MRFFLLVFIGITLLTQCNNSSSESDLIQPGTMMNSPVQDTCSCNDLILDSLNVYTKNDTLFTGVCVLNYPTTDLKYVVKGILNGKLHGSVIYYDKMGNELVKEIYDSGNKKRSGESAPLTCDCAELDLVSSPGETIKRSFLDEIPFTGKCQKKYPESNQIYMEVNYKSGLLNGFTVFYDKTGETLYMEKYENGELVKIIYE